MSFAPINQTGPYDVVPAQAGKIIVLEGYKLSSGGAVTVRWQSANPTTATDLSGPLQIGAGLNIGEDSVQMGLLQTIAGEGLRLLCSGQVGGYIRYSYRG